MSKRRQPQPGPRVPETENQGRAIDPRPSNPTRAAPESRAGRSDTRQLPSPGYPARGNGHCAGSPGRELAFERSPSHVRFVQRDTNGMDGARGSTELAGIDLLHHAIENNPGQELSRGVLALEFRFLIEVAIAQRAEEFAQW